MFESAVDPTFSGYLTHLASIQAATARKRSDLIKRTPVVLPAAFLLTPSLTRQYDSRVLWGRYSWMLINFSA